MKEGLREKLKYSAILLLIIIISIFHYKTSTDRRYLHEIYQRIYYIPIVLAAFWYGPIKGVLAATLTSLIYIYHIHRDWAHFPVYAFNQYAEIFLYHAIALTIGLLASKERRYREKLERTSARLSEAYEKLRSTFEQLRRADRLAALGQLSAGLAHEIRNPLGSIKGSVEILENDIPPRHPRYEFVKIIKDEVARLNAIVGEFLKFARPSDPQFEEGSVNELIESTCRLLNKQAREAKVQIVTDLDPSLPNLSMDRDQIRQVLLNVMLNGIQAMREGGELRISSRCMAPAGLLLIDISDEGPGILEEDRERIFDPFFTTKPLGTGLGLSVSYQLVKNHQGEIAVKSNERKGTTFRLQFPLGRSFSAGEGETRSPRASSG